VKIAIEISGAETPVEDLEEKTGKLWGASCQKDAQCIASPVLAYCDADKDEGTCRPAVAFWVLLVLLLLAGIGCICCCCRP
jgi:hypothetical protein